MDISVAYPTEEQWAGLNGRLTPLSRDTVLELCVQLSFRVGGDIVELGVAEGYSTRTLRRALTRCERGQLRGPRKSIFACDSFEGLTEKFENAVPGTFACDPPDIRGVEIVKGYYDNSLTTALARRIGAVAFASLDADLYSSTLTALRWLTPLLGTGSLLLFDEYLGEKASERRAHEDWCQETGVQTFMLAEFLRDPSAWSTNPDRRTLFQVVRDSPCRPTDVTNAWQVMRRAGSFAKRGVGRLSR